jgi:hypothetical protein
MGRFIDITGAPIVSDFQEMPLDFMAKALSAKQASYDKADAELDLYSKLIPKGGEATTLLYDPVKKEYIPKLEEYSKNLIQDPEGVGRSLSKWKAKLENDPRYQALKADEDYKKTLYTRMQESGKKGNFIPLWRHTKTPLNPQEVQEGLINFTPEQYYDIREFDDPGKYVDDQLDDIKTMVISNSKENIRDIVAGADGGLYGITTSGSRTSNLLNDNTIVPGTGKTIGQLVQEKLISVTNNLVSDQGAAPLYYRDAVKYGYAPTFNEKDPYAQASAFVTNRFKRFENVGVDNKTNYNQLLSASAREAMEPKTPQVLPFKTNFDNSPYTFADFQKAAQTSTKTRNEGWVNAKTTISGLSPQLLRAAGVTKSALGAINEYDLDKIIKYAASVDPNSLQTGDRDALDTARTSAIQYFASKRTLDFYQNQILKAVDDVYAKNKKEFKGDALVTFENEYKELKGNIKNGDYSLNSRFEPRAGIGTGKTVAQSLFKNPVEDILSKSGALNISNAYISLDPTSKGYSKPAIDLGNNIWNEASGKKGAFIGQSPTADASEGLADLFKKQTGTAPKGKLTPKGAAVDENGRIGVIVEDSETGNVATFVKDVNLEYTPAVKDYYKDIANSNDYIAKPVAYTGYLDMYLTQQGQKSSFDNFLNANYDTSYNLGGINIIKSGNTFTYKDDTGTHQFKKPSALKADLGETIILSGN